MANPDKILTLATRTGKALLESGAETYRVEDTICRICRSLHMEEAESICLPTGIYVTAMMNGKSYTKIAQISLTINGEGTLTLSSSFCTDGNELFETNNSDISFKIKDWRKILCPRPLLTAF